MKKDISRAIRLINELNEKYIWINSENSLQRNPDILVKSENANVIHSVKAGIGKYKWTNLYVFDLGKMFVFEMENGYYMVKRDILGLRHNLFLIKDNQLIKSFLIKKESNMEDTAKLEKQIQGVINAI